MRIILRFYYSFRQFVADLNGNYYESVYWSRQRERLR